MNPSIHLHKAPLYPVRRKRWAIAIRTAKELTPHMRVCSKHFKKDDYLPTGTTKASLKKIAVPSQNLPVRSLEKAETFPVKREKTGLADRSRKRCMLACEEHNELDSRATAIA